MTADELATSDLDVQILKLADHSTPEQIAATLGGVLTPARVRLRLSEMLESNNWPSDAQREQLTLWKMNRLLSRIENMIGADFDLNNLKLQLATLKEIGNRLDKRRAATEVDLNTYHRNVAMEMVRVYDIALAYIKGALREQVDPAKWDEAARDALLHAREEVMKKAIES